MGLKCALRCTPLERVRIRERAAEYGRAFVDAFSSRGRKILAWLDAHGLLWSAALT